MSNRKEQTPSQIYNNFWKDIVEVKGKPIMSRIKKELYDYHFLLKQVPKVYSAISEGLLSKPNYYASVMIEQLEEKFYSKDAVQDEIKDMIKNAKDKEGLVKMLSDYFEIEE